MISKLLLDPMSSFFAFPNLSTLTLGLRQRRDQAKQASSYAR